MFGFECKIPIHALIWQAKKLIMYKQCAFDNIPKISSFSQLHIKDNPLNIFMKMSTNAP